MPETFSMLLPFIILIAVFWLFFIRPQSKAAKTRQAMLSALKAGDKVETVSRVTGVVVSVQDQHLVLNIGEGEPVRIRIHRDGVARVIENKTLETA
ncbi:MAG: preprotein translocase subunit YajC [Proteobacteria bacterium]|nr:preprotein translocase subunit YajC [Pseudomonadota bacterium]